MRKMSQSSKCSPNKGKSPIILTVRCLESYVQTNWAAAIMMSAKLITFLKILFELIWKMKRFRIAMQFCLELSQAQIRRMVSFSLVTKLYWFIVLMLSIQSTSLYPIQISQHVNSTSNFKDYSRIINRYSWQYLVVYLAVNFLKRVKDQEMWRMKWFSQ